MHDCIIIGAGISGLGVAARLAMQEKDILVLERAQHVGGTIRSQHVQGYLVEFGPTTVLHTTPLLDDLVRYAGLEQERCFASAHHRKRYIVRDGKMHALPLGPGALLTSGLFSARAKLHLFQEPFIPPGAAEESIGAFTRRRLGEEFLDYAISPYVAGVYAGDPARLSVPWAFPKLYALEQQYGSLLKGALLGGRARKRRQESTGERRKDTARIFSFRRGIAALPAAIAARLGPRVVRGCEIRACAREQHGYTVTYQGPHGPVRARGRCLVLAVPAYALDGYMHMCNPRYPGGVAAITYAPVVQVFLGLRQEQVGHPLDGFGVLLPSRERHKLLGVFWNSSLFPARAPAGCVALTAFLGGMLRRDMVALDEAQLVALCLEELETLLAVRGTPELVRVKKWPQAIPQYQLGYGTFVSLMAAFEAQTPGVFLSSNCRGGIAVGDCVRQAAETAAKVVAFLEAPQHPCALPSCC
jgi:oxygen-dependent protoporphyrinogen oxidase